MVTLSTFHLLAGEAVEIVSHQLELSLLPERTLYFFSNMDTLKAAC